jgi:histidinol-phosphate/aromatic aminotransferase/cobyric acid decarboxylase-like protein
MTQLQEACRRFWLSLVRRESFLALLKQCAIARLVDNCGLPHYLWISIKTEVENTRLVEVLGNVLQE